MRYATLSGTIVGRLWMPGAVASKHVSARIERNSADTFTHGGPYPTLRDAMLALTTDGDFQSCGFDPNDCWLTVVEETPVVGGMSKRRTRTRQIRFACWDTDDMRASEDVMGEYESAVTYEDDGWPSAEFER